MRTVGLHLTLIVSAALLSGCCATTQQAAAIRHELESRNRERAEPAMRAAALQRGALLLPGATEEVPLPPVCGDVFFDWTGLLFPKGMCVERSADRVFHLKAVGQATRFVVQVPTQGWPYARLARRGSTLFVLVPRVTRRKVGDRTACECGSMTRPVIPTVFGFFIDDAEQVEVEEVVVPITEDFIEWKCKAYSM